MKNRLKIVAVITLPLALALAGCTVNDAAPNASATGSNAADAEVKAAGIPSDAVASLTKDAKLAALVPEKYVKAGITEGNDGEFLPMRTQFQGVQRGVDADVIRGIGAVLGLKVNDLQVDFDGLIPGLKSSRIDVIASSMADYKERQKEVDFVDYFQSAVSLVVAKGNPAGISTLTDLCGKKVATLRGSGAANAVDAESKKCTDGGKPEISVSLFPDTAATMNQLLTGRADAVTNDLPPAVYAAKTLQDGKAVEVAKQPLYTGFFYGLGFRKEDAALRDAVKAALQHLIDTGWYANLLKSYGLESGALKTATTNGGGDRPFSS
ncbi:ABC transporter substrate-binding protein (plasmid) [Arthrobacter sp. KN11-1C]|uniref:ABC transporter substrate-binding protein n=1 Tax=Arthrobacter sp. KN11-1C TaxID=3445774 RepID=UPI003FA13411